MAYVYWFDEPDPKDYAFVQAGVDRLKKYAPGLQTFITKHELQKDWKGTIDIWCPLTPFYNHDAAQAASGARRTILVVRLLRPARPLLHALYRPSGHRSAGLAVADVAAEHRGRSGLGIDLLDARAAILPKILYEDPMSYAQRDAAGGKQAIGATATGGSSIRRWRPPRRA